MSLPEEQPSQSAPSGPALQGAVGRVSRLALKELRETLRDRRTVITLLLMPLLIYPLISIAFQRFLLSNMRQSAQVVYRIGFESHEDGALLIRQLRRGSNLLAGDESEPESDEEFELSLDSLAGIDAKVDERDIQLFWNSQLERDVANYSIDLGIRLRNGEELRSSDDNSSQLDCELIFLDSSSIGRDAARYAERRFRAVNERVLEYRLRRLGATGRLLPISTYVKPIHQLGQETSSLYSLAALVPLILILMTITGAVYPAIDLTAGERERGTLEVLIAAPVPRLQLLLAKYIAVLTVALLTASVNLVTMTVVILSIGLGPMLFGDAGISLHVILQVFGLLILFAAFFSAILLALTSFARSFKEAQAYLIPLILVSIAPGMLSIIPDIELKGVLAVTPLVNIVLLARDLFEKTAEPAIVLVVTISTAFFALAAIAVAARIFGTDAILYGSRGSWSDLFRRPVHESEAPTITGAMLCLALMFPAYFLLSNMLARMVAASIELRLGLMSLITILLFGELPLAVAVLNRVRLGTGFRVRRTKRVFFAAAVVLGLTLWPFAHEIVVLQSRIGLATIDADQFQHVKALLSSLQQISPVWILITWAVVPAVFEEFFFRGFLLSALCSRMRPMNAVVISGVMFGLFHLLVTDQMIVIRFLPTALLGMVLGWVCIRSGSILPGMILHGCHNGLLAMITYFHVRDPESINTWLSWLSREVDPSQLTGPLPEILPIPLLVAAAVGVLIGCILISRNGQSDESTPFPIDAASVIR